MAFLRFLMLLALVVWLGGLIFFAFVVAPTVFSPGLLPTRHLAGEIVGRSLGALHWMGIVSGIVFWITVASGRALPADRPDAAIDRSFAVRYFAKNARPSRRSRRNRQPPAGQPYSHGVQSPAPLVGEVRAGRISTRIGCALSYRSRPALAAGEKINAVLIRTFRRTKIQQL